MTRFDKIRNVCIKGSVVVVSTAGKMRKNRLYGHVERRTIYEVVKKVRKIGKEVEEKLGLIKN